FTPPSYIHPIGLFFLCGSTVRLVSWRALAKVSMLRQGFAPVLGTDAQGRAGTKDNSLVGGAHAEGWDRGLAPRREPVPDVCSPRGGARGRGLRRRQGEGGGVRARLPGAGATVASLRVRRLHGAARARPGRGRHRDAAAVPYGTVDRGSG